MKVVAQIILGILFSVFLSLLILLITLRFQVLNYDFVSSSLEKGGVYQKVPVILQEGLEMEKIIDREESQGYQQIIARVTPELTKDITEKNLRRIINFIDGKNNNLSLYLPFRQLGIPVGFAGDEIPLEGFIQTNQSSGIQLINNLGIYLWVVLALTIILLAATTFGLFKINNSVESLGLNLIINGLTFVLSALLVKLTISTTTSEWERSIEPTHKLFALIAPTLISDILTTWILIGGVLFVTGIGLLIYRKLVTNKLKSGN